MRNQSGFTLIEAMVSGIISVIIPGVLLTLISVNNTELAYNSSQLRLTQIANVVSEEIRETAFRSTSVYSGTEEAAGLCPVPGAAATQEFGLTSVVFCDANRQVIKRYRVSFFVQGTGQLEERAAGVPEWTPVVVGADTVRMHLDPQPYQPKMGGLFGLITGSKGHFMFFNFHYNMRVGTTQSTLSMQTESVVCRNAPSYL